MEDLDDKPSRFHELNNAIHVVQVTTAVINRTLEEQGRQSGRIEAAVSSVNTRLDRFDVRMNDIEKSQIAFKGDMEKQISDVRSDVQERVTKATAEFKEQLALLSPVRLIVYGAVVMILTGVMNVWITNAMVGRQEAARAVQSTPGQVHP